MNNKGNTDVQAKGVNLMSVFEVEGDIHCNGINIHDVKLQVGAPRSLINAHRLTE